MRRLTPMSKNSVFKKRRLLLAKYMEPNSTAIISSSPIQIRNNDSAYRYRQCSNFYYLTGFEKPDSVLLIYKNRSNSVVHFFSKQPNKHDSVWSGELLTSRKIQNIYGFDKCGYTENLELELYGYLKKSKSIYHSLSKQSDLLTLVDGCLQKIENNYRKGAELPSNHYSINKIIHKLRLIKSNEEIAIIKKACKISADAHINLMRKCKPNVSEKQIESQLLYDFGSNNATEAYTSIVAGGKNACILHYIDNSSKLKNGDLLLTDAACEFEYYASDITRTIPINGRFTQDQKLIYSLVLRAQKNAISKCLVGNTLQDIHKAAVRTLTKGLIDLGLLRGDYKSIVKNELYKKFYMHNTGHWMGLDVHDPLEYVSDGKPVKLKPGMIFTVEPGLYIRADKDVNKRFHNIGIRIEDDILITKNGPDVLTSRAPKEIRDIENIMNNIK